MFNYLTFLIKSILLIKILGVSSLILDLNIDISNSLYNSYSSYNSYPDFIHNWETSINKYSLENTNFQLSTKLKIGNPTQYINMILDTGNSYSWIYDKTKNTNQNSGYFPNKSKSYQDTGNITSFPYKSSIIIGPMGSDIIGFTDNYVISNFILTNKSISHNQLDNEAYLTDGVLGLGLDLVKDPVSKDITSGDNSWFSRLIASSNNTLDYFSFDINLTPGKKSRFSIGEYLDRSLIVYDKGNWLPAYQSDQFTEYYFKRYTPSVIYNWLTNTGEIKIDGLITRDILEVHDANFHQTCSRDAISLLSV